MRNNSAMSLDLLLRPYKGKFVILPVPHSVNVLNIS
jgi:hypothetical protein